MTSPTTLPVELVEKCLAIADEWHRRVSASNLSSKMWTKRNMGAMVLIPEAFAVARRATSSHKARVFLWILGILIIVLSLWLTWWSLLFFGLAATIERSLARKERRCWIAIASILLSSEMLACDFAGWGTMYPEAQDASLHALGGGAAKLSNTEWMDYYLPYRANISRDDLKMFGPGGKWKEEL